MRKHLAIFILGLTLSTPALAEDLVITFINLTGDTHRGCVAYGYRADGTKKGSGVHPVPSGQSYVFNLGQCSQYTQWRFVAAVDYSDAPENNDIVLMDTGQRPVSKCTWEITGRRGNS
jgi:hypothetical protein